MTHKATLPQTGSTKKLTDSKLANAIELHCAKERASFHTPGHKGGSNFRCGQNLWALDVTELPGLDELAYADGVLGDLQKRAAQIWGSTASFISTNGASAALMAAVIACAPRGSRILLPQNVHRSVINALVLTGLEPVWFEPRFDQDLGTWSSIDVEQVRTDLEKYAPDLAAAVVVSPSYSGSVSDVAKFADYCRRYGVASIVDEAHGAHFGFANALPPHAVTSGADLVIHSLHKTLSAMTQTGIIHIGRTSLIEPDQVRLALNMLQSSSPNYVLMTSIESALAELGSRFYIERAVELASAARRQLATVEGIHIYSDSNFDPLHLLVRLDGLSAEELYSELAEHGVFAEAVIGKSVLLLLGCGTVKADVEVLLAALNQIGTKADPLLSDNSYRFNGMSSEQVLSPRQAFFAKTETIPIKDAIGRIAAECVAPCPPGSPIIVPGQRVSAAALEFCKIPALRVVLESQRGEQ